MADKPLPVGRITLSPTLTTRPITANPVQTRPHCCPVCYGRGTVPAGFYATHIAITSSTNAESCRACGGDGILWR